LELVLLVGLQASGKSTFCRDRLPGHVRVSKDLLRSSRDRETRQRGQIRAALRQGHDVVVDNTNVRVDDRRPLIDLGREHGARVVGFVFESPLADCLRRNAAREGRARIPDVGLHVTRHRYQRPSAEEGFDALWSVRLIEGRPFEVVAFERRA
jgi:predicted kinase